MFTLYNVISSDGFIARKNGSEDFIPDGLWPNFLELCKKYGALIMGRKTYDAIQNYGEELLRPLEELPIKKIIISKNKNFKAKEGYTVANSPEEALKISSEALVSSGPTLNNHLLEMGLVDKIILCEISISLGEGIKPFDSRGIILTPIGPVSEINGAKVQEYNVRMASPHTNFLKS